MNTSTWRGRLQHETKKATRTIHYVANTVDGKQLKDDTRQSVTLNGTYYTDAVTGKRVATKTVNEQTVVDPSEPASETWTVDPTTVADLTTDQKGFKAVTTPQTISLTTRDAQSRGVNSGNWDLIDHQDNGDVSYGDPHDTAWTSATPKEVTEAYLIYSQPTQPTKPTTNPTAPTQPTKPATTPTQSTKPATNPTSPTQPTQPATTPTAPTQLSAPTPVTPGQVTTLNQQPTSPVRQTLPAAQSTSARLPQTGSQHEKGALVLGLTALMAALGLAGHRRKQN
ncbi:mucin-binding protein [Limosilactobacillus pontis]|uniref:mucin-binding protein n=1 Tax=Limosilactobacillus pontis TaxID=35787 RepID=UPI003FA5336E